MSSLPYVEQLLLIRYCVRFDEMYSATTAIKFVTDGMLVRETMRDPLLSNYSVVMVGGAPGPFEGPFDYWNMDFFAFAIVPHMAASLPASPPPTPLPPSL